MLTGCSLHNMCHICFHLLLAVKILLLPIIEKTDQCATSVPQNQENMSVQCIPPCTPILYSKTGVRRGIPIFLIFVPKHRMWILVRRGGSNVYPQSMFWAKIIKNIKIFPMKFSIFTAEKKSLYIAWASFRYGIGRTCFWRGKYQL